MSALDVAVEGVAVCAAGLPDWDTARAVLAGARDPDTAVRPPPSPTVLAPNERRRAGEAVRYALAVAERACAMARREPRDLPNVFASCYGDLAISDYLCAELARAPQALSPTRFHNSVHNAAAGYWSIATGCMAASSAISAGADTFAAGLLEAATLAVCEATPVLYAACDIPARGPLREVIDCDAPFAIACVLAPFSPHADALARLRLSLGETAAGTPATPPGGMHNPIARGLPLLAALARREAVRLDYRLGARDHARPSHLLVEISV